MLQVDFDRPSWSHTYSCSSNRYRDWQAYNKDHNQIDWLRTYWEIKLVCRKIHEFCSYKVLNCFLLNLALIYRTSLPFGPLNTEFILERMNRRLAEEMARRFVRRMARQKQEVSRADAQPKQALLKRKCQRVMVITSMLVEQKWWEDHMFYQV